MTIPDDKAALRVRLRTARQAAALALPDAARTAANLAPVDRFPAFACVGAYRPMGAELDPAPLLRRLAETGAMIALPRASDRDGPLNYYLWGEDGPLEPDAFGVPSPAPSAPLAHPDLIISPLVGFDRRGGRLGQGGGTYDRTLANLRAGRRVFVLGLAYSVQEADEIPYEPHDQRLDAVLTEAAYLEFGD